MKTTFSLLQKKVDMHNKDDILIVRENIKPKEKQKKLWKLHKQFWHASADRLKNIITYSGKNKECTTILKDIVKNCETCIRYSRLKPKSAVGLPMASASDETAAMNLHELEHGVWYLHVMDHFRHFSAGNIITTKNPRR